MDLVPERIGYRFSRLFPGSGFCDFPIPILVDELIDLRDAFRQSRDWVAADALRASLQRADIIIEDTKDGPRWRLGT